MDDFMGDVMEQSDVVTIAATIVFLMVFGVVSFCFAPKIQRVALKMMGQPSNTFAAWSYKMAASKTSLQSIRSTGAISVAAGVALLLLLAIR